jgi:hypothetical protein
MGRKITRFYWENKVKYRRNYMKKHMLQYV